MKLFISWSGDLSHRIAKELKEWFPQIMPHIIPFLSSEDIKKGQNWITKIFSELDVSDFGIICLTRENFKEPWILFEAGALSKNLRNSRLSCLLFDNLNQKDLVGPLSFFQNTEFNKEDFRKLVHSINDASGDISINQKVLEKSFEKWFPDLEKSIKKIQDEHSNYSRYFELFTNKSNDQNIVENILHKNIRLIIDTFDFTRFSKEQPIEYLSNTFNHPIQVRVNPVIDKDGILKEVLITSKGIDIKPSEGPYGRGVLIEIIFYSEDHLLWKLTYHFHKGETYIKTEVIENLSSSTNGDFDVIWRD